MMGIPALVAQLLIGLVLALSGAMKLIHPLRFAEGVRSFGILPRLLTIPAAFGLILTELVVAGSLLSGVGIRFAIPVAIALFLLFIAVMLKNLRRDQPLPCHCFGADEDEADIHPRRSLARLVLLLAAALLAAFGDGVAWDATPAASLSVGTFFLALAGLLLGGWLLRLPDLWEFHRTSVPLFTAPGRRVSLRTLAVEPLPQS